MKYLRARQCTARSPARRSAAAILALATAAALADGNALYAETSSWVQRDSEARPAPAPARAKPKLTRSAKTTSEQGPEGAFSGPAVSQHPKTQHRFEKGAPRNGIQKPPPGHDDAYLAFDQGRYLTALDLAQKLAEKGDARAHTLIARIYAEGLGVPRNDVLAAKWYKRAAELGDVDGIFAYGVILAEGRGVKKDRDGAAQMFERAARTGHAAANYNLGLLFLKGDGKPENPYRAAQHIRYAAEQGIAAAQYDLATLYQAGSGVPHDALQTAHWLHAAAEQGMPAAQYDYAVLLLKGLGLKADEPKAIDYLKAAADNNIPGAQNRLAHVYREGVGVKKDEAEAAKWRLIAKAGGIAEDKILDKLVADLSKAEREKAERAAMMWREKKLLPF